MTILRAGDPGATDVVCLDTVTNQVVMGVVQVDTETGEAWVYAMDRGKLRRKDGMILVEKYKHPIKVIRKKK